MIILKTNQNEEVLNKLNKKQKQPFVFCIYINTKNCTVRSENKLQ